MKLRILLADDHEIVRRGLRSLLEKHEGWEVCGEASDGRDAIEKALQLKPDVVIVDIGMPNLNGLDTTRQLLQHDANFKVIVLTITDSDQVIREALDAGARGFLEIRCGPRPRDCGRGTSEQAHVLHSACQRPGAGRLSGKGTLCYPQRASQAADVNGSRTRDHAVAGGGQQLEGSRMPSEPEHQDRRDASQQYHAEAELSLHPRSGCVRHQEQSHPDRDTAATAEIAGRLYGSLVLSAARLDLRRVSPE